MQHILTETAEGILTITLNRPDKLNALNRQLLAEIRLAVEAAGDDAEVKAIIITGSGEKAFAAGADIEEFAHFSSEAGRALSAHGHGVMDAIENSRKPVVAAVNGFALGGGCELAMACHMRIAANNARFGQPEVNLGLIPGYAGTQRLPQLVGKAKAIELLLTGDMVGAEEAHRIGLVNAVVAPEDLVATTRAMLQKVLQKGPLAVAICLELVNTFYNKERDGFAAEIDAFGQLFDSHDFAEGTQAFLGKRKAVFKGE